jgi:quercetin dioxygenase-like cupin family protein
MQFDLTGWAFGNGNQVPWQALGDHVEIKVLGAADGKVIALFRFAPGWVGGSHFHEDAEFTYILEGDLASNGVAMTAGHAYAARAGTRHEEHRTDNGCTIVSVFKSPS